MNLFKVTVTEPTRPGVEYLLSEKKFLNHGEVNVFLRTSIFYISEIELVEENVLLASDDLLPAYKVFEITFMGGESVMIYTPPSFILNVQKINEMLPEKFRNEQLIWVKELYFCKLLKEN